jgi:Cysteine-rich secretory protein family
MKDFFLRRGVQLRTLGHRCVTDPFSVVPRHAAGQAHKEDFPMTRTFRFFVLALLTLPTSWLDTESATAQEMLTSQNVKRSSHCAPPFAWSNTLAAAAQHWANVCTRDPTNPTGFAHSPANTRPNQGENLAWGTGNFTAESAVELWYKEINHYNFSSPGFSPATGHFTQMVWKNSTQLGCAMAHCSGETFWVCRYSPQGNITNPGQFKQNVMPATCTR